MLSDKLHFQSSLCTLQNIVSKIIAPQTQESFKVAAARRTVEEAITKRDELKRDFDQALGDRLNKYGIIVLDTSVVDLAFSPEFSRATLPACHMLPAASTAPDASDHAARISGPAAVRLPRA